jgi:hypothetical protein
MPSPRLTAFVYLSLPAPSRLPPRFRLLRAVVRVEQISTSLPKRHPTAPPLSRLLTLERKQTCESAWFTARSTADTKLQAESARREHKSHPPECQRPRACPICLGHRQCW